LASVAPNMPGFPFRSERKKDLCRGMEEKCCHFESYSMQIHPDPNMTKFGVKFGISGSWRRPQTGTGRSNWNDQGTGYWVTCPRHPNVHRPCKLWFSRPRAINKCPILGSQSESQSRSGSQRGTCDMTFNLITFLWPNRLLPFQT
jgi:hypothetical protein